MNILSVLHCEIRKIIRSNVFWIIFLVLGFGPIMMGVGNVLSSDAGGVSWEQYLTGLLDTLAPLKHRIYLCCGMGIRTGICG